MTNNQLDRERLEKIKSWRETYGAGSNVMLPAEEAEELARMALAAIDSESVGTLSVRHMSYSGKKIGNQFGFVHSDAAMTIAEGDYPLYRHAQPEPEYPEVLPCSVLLEPGLRFGKGIKTSTMLAALARRAVHESDMAALSPEERAEFQAGIEDFKSLIAQPAPVVPPNAEFSPAVITSCHECGSESLTWDATVVSNTSVQNGRLRLSDVSGLFYLGCDECSETLARVDATEIAAYLNGCRAAMLQAQPQNAPQNIPEIIPDCWCRTCRPVVLNDMRFVVCPDCGNKRCPRANDHRNACTGSNEPGQEGSAYPDTSREVK